MHSCLKKLKQKFVVSHVSVSFWIELKTLSRLTREEEGEGENLRNPERRDKG